MTDRLTELDRVRAARVFAAYKYFETELGPVLSDEHVRTRRDVASRLAHAFFIAEARDELRDGVVQLREIDATLCEHIGKSLSEIANR